MIKTLKTGILIFLGVMLLTKQNMCEHPDLQGFGQLRAAQLAGDSLSLPASGMRAEIRGEEVNDSIYQWNHQSPGWKAMTALPVVKTSSVRWAKSEEGVHIDWELLTNIQYKLEYFPSLEAEMYTPIFGPKLEELDGKEVQLSGYVIPFDPSGRLVALSANPMASCFFCGKASPASIMSLHLKDQEEYQIDDFLAFTGTLQLNYDDPNEYYYILKYAQPLETP